MRFILPLLLVACASAPVLPTAQTEPAATTSPVLDQPERARVPRGCEVNLAGRYFLSTRPAQRYLVEDDGTHVLVRPESSSAGGRSSALVLDRTWRGFVGMITGVATTASGASCPVAFGAQIVACSPDGLTIRSVESLSLDGQCGATASDAVTETLLRRE